MTRDAYNVPVSVCRKPFKMEAAAETALHYPSTGAASLQYLQYKELSTHAKDVQSIHSSLECMEFIQARSMKAGPIQSGGEY